MAFSKYEPFGSGAMFYGHAMTTSMIANVYRKRGSEPIKPRDVMPEFGQKKPQPVEDMIGIVAGITQAFGGKDKRK